MQAEYSLSPEQNYSQGLKCFSQNNFTQGIQYLKQAAIKDYHPAIKNWDYAFFMG